MTGIAKSTNTTAHMTMLPTGSHLPDQAITHSHTPMDGESYENKHERTHLTTLEAAVVPKTHGNCWREAE